MNVVWLLVWIIASTYFLMLSGDITVSIEHYGRTPVLSKKFRNRKSCVEQIDERN